MEQNTIKDYDNLDDDYPDECIKNREDESTIKKNMEELYELGLMLNEDFNNYKIPFFKKVYYFFIKPFFKLCIYLLKVFFIFPFESIIYLTSPFYKKYKKPYKLLVLKKKLIRLYNYLSYKKIKFELIINSKEKISYFKINDKVFFQNWFDIMYINQENQFIVKPRGKENYLTLQTAIQRKLKRLNENYPLNKCFILVSENYTLLDAKDLNKNNIYVYKNYREYKKIVLENKKP